METPVDYLCVAESGMVCPVGLSASAACSAMRAGIARFDELSYRDKRLRPIIGSSVPGFDPKLKSTERLIELLWLALRDCLDQNLDLNWHDIPLLLGLAETGRPGSAAHLGPSIIGEVQKRLQTVFHPELSRVVPSGHVAGFEALRIVRELFLNTNSPACLVCGVDSYLNAGALHWLEQSSRLKTEDNSDGVIPGEAAAAVLLFRGSARNSEIQTSIVGIGYGREHAPVLSDEPLLGLGLTHAVREALAEAKVKMDDISFRICDVTGESYGFKEQSLMLARLLRVHKEQFPTWHYADSIGDIGAAAGVCQLIVADHAMRKRYAYGSGALCLTSSVPGHRAAAIVQAGREFR
jgi:3-oxoacyl-[acyl-carrier-protein] synthase I